MWLLPFALCGFCSAKEGGMFYIKAEISLLAVFSITFQRAATSKDCVKDCTPDWAAKLTDIPAGQIKKTTNSVITITQVRTSG